MITIDVGEIEDGEVKEIEVRLGNFRLVNLSINQHNMAIQMPVGVRQEASMNGLTSTYIRTHDYR